LPLRTSQNEIIANLPEYFSETGYHNPGDAYNGPFQYTRKTKLHCFDWLATQPEKQQRFNLVMSLSALLRGQPWFEYFPVLSKLSVELPSDILLIDVGGGVGHELIALKKHYPTLTGKLIVQEIPAVVDSIANLPAGIEAMKHDFFAPQPIKGAKAYYLANVLHDWPDKQAVVILQNIRDAMTADSLLLINEAVLPEWKVPIASASADMLMMANFSSLERTEEQFRALLDGVGFELVNLWAPDDSAKGSQRRVLEAVLKKSS